MAKSQPAAEFSNGLVAPGTLCQNCQVSGAQRAAAARVTAMETGLKIALLGSGKMGKLVECLAGTPAEPELVSK